MMLLRLIGYIMVYSGLGVLLHFFITDQATSLIVGASLLMVGAILLWITHDASSSKQSSMWDWLDCLELPFELLGWLFKAIFKIFD